MPDEGRIIHVSKRHKSADIPEYKQGGKCPKCNSPTEDGFGLAGGGFGVYTYCPKCEEVVTKSEFPDA